MKEEKPPEVSFQVSLAEAMHVQEKDVEVMESGLLGEVVEQALILFLAAKVDVGSLQPGVFNKLRANFCSTSEPSRAERAAFLKSWAAALQNAAVMDLRRLKHVQALSLALQSPDAEVLEVTCSEYHPPSFDLGASIQQGVSSTGSWLHDHEQTLLLLLLLLLLAVAMWAALIYGPRGYQKLTGPDQRTIRRTLAQRFESRAARIERVKSRVEKYSQRALDLVMAPEPDFEDTELLYYVKVLNRCRSHAKVMCGSAWGQWHSAGDCELCKRRVDRAEKGCQCAQGGHRLCWRCMVSIMNWESLASQEGQFSWSWAIKDWL
ncbi:unnamed protein product [Effrenium voratum]|nr:unnamed protein product [Effrenium voratum]